jgi:hypothetical protein
MMADGLAITDALGWAGFRITAFLNVSLQSVDCFAKRLFIP